MAEVEMTESEYEDELNRSYKVGESSGLGEAGGILMGHAKVYFENENDKVANILRELSKDMIKKAKETHPGVPEIPKKK